VKSLCSVASFVLFFVTGGIPMFPQGSSAPAETEIRSVMAQIRTASLEGDSDKVSSLMADDYIQTDISGHVQDKQTWLREYFNPLAELIKAGKFRWEVYDRKTSSFAFMANPLLSSVLSKERALAQNWCRRPILEPPTQTQVLLARCVSPTFMSNGMVAGCLRHCKTQSQFHPLQANKAESEHIETDHERFVTLSAHALQHTSPSLSVANLQTVAVQLERTRLVSIGVIR
jgi:hypothetical protein